MNDDPLFNELREARWRRKLTAAEEVRLQAWLAAHPAERADWAAEEAVSRLMENLADVPVASNFTARVLQTVELEKAIGARQAQSGWLGRRWWAGWLPRLAGAALLMGMGWFSGYQAHQAHRTHLAQSVATVSTVPSVPSPEILQDFDTISALNAAPGADEKLLALLK